MDAETEEHGSGLVQGSGPATESLFHTQRIAEGMFQLSRNGTGSGSYTRGSVDSPFSRYAAKIEHGNEKGPDAFDVSARCDSDGVQSRTAGHAVCTLRADNVLEIVSVLAVTHRFVAVCSVMRCFDQRTVFALILLKAGRFTCTYPRCVAGPYRFINNHTPVSLPTTTKNVPGRPQVAAKVFNFQHSSVKNQRDSAVSMLASRLSRYVCACGVIQFKTLLLKIYISIRQYQS